MKPGFHRILWWLFISTMILLLTSSSVLDRETNTKARETIFHPYSDVTVPKLKDLIRRKGFRLYTDQKPYLLGYSYDGIYMATVLYDPEVKFYRIDIHHTVENRLEETVYVPRGEELDMAVEKGSASEEEELLKGAQETLDMGYRIQVPVRPQEYSIQQKAQTGMGNWRVYPDIKRDRVLWQAEEGRNRWSVTSLILNKGDRMKPYWLLATPPGSKGKWTLVANRKSGKNGRQVFVYTVDSSRLPMDWSEKHIQKRLKEWIGGKREVVFQGDWTKKGPECMLVVRDAVYSRIDPQGGIGYKGEVKGFILIDSFGNVQYRGNTAGLVYKEKVRLDPTIPKSDETHYRMLLTVGRNKSGSKERNLTVDQLDKEDQVVRTYEWKWNEEQGEFQLRETQKN